MKIIEGEPSLTDEETAILMGVGVDLLRAEIKRQGIGTPTQLPDAWLESSRRRWREYRTATGRADVAGAINWLEEPMKTEVTTVDRCPHCGVLVVAAIAEAVRRGELTCPRKWR